MMLRPALRPPLRAPMRGPLTPIKGGGDTKLRAAVAQWQADEAATRRLFGGSEAAQNGSSVLSGGSAASRTFLLTEASPSIRQAGLIRQIKAIVRTTGGGTVNGLKFKVFRPNGSNYEFVSESEFISVNTANAFSLETFDLSQPMACKPGDRIGVWMKQGTALVSVAINSSGSWGYVTGDQTTTFAASSMTTGTGGRLCMAGYGISPFVVSTGDSIMRGANLGDPNKWYSHYDSGPYGNRNADIYETVWTLAGVESQNFAAGGATWVETLAKVADIDALASQVVHVHCGVNDVSGGRLIADVLDDMDDFRAGLTNGQVLLIDEILPWTAGNDVQAASVREFNDAYATWCAANGATLVVCHDAMGKVRVSTGELDDLITAYDLDGVHLLAPGVAKMGEIYATAMNAITF